MLESRTWYHTIDLPDGGATPGWIDTRPVAAMIPWPATLPGSRCLDVGTFDGFWAFDMEHRGAAEVIAIDVDEPEELDFSPEYTAGPDNVRQLGAVRGPGFEAAKSALGSSVIRKNRSVYDLNPAEDGKFDVVLCGCLLLHLRDPILALEKIHDICRGTLILVETLDPRLEIVAPLYAAAAVHPFDDQWWLANSRAIDRFLVMSKFKTVYRSRRFLFPPWAGRAPPKSSPLEYGNSRPQAGAAGDRRADLDGATSRALGARIGPRRPGF